MLVQLTPMLGLPSPSHLSRGKLPRFPRTSFPTPRINAKIVVSRIGLKLKKNVDPVFRDAASDSDWGEYPPVPPRNSEIRKETKKDSFPAALLFFFPSSIRKTEIRTRRSTGSQLPYDCTVSASAIIHRGPLVVLSTSDGPDSVRPAPAVLSLTAHLCDRAGRGKDF